MNTVKAFDIAEDASGHFSDFAQAGFEAVGLYARLDRSPLTAVQDAHKAELKIFTIFETGFPTGPRYFTQNQGYSDGEAAIEWIYAVDPGNLAWGKPIFACVDYEASESDLPAIHSYFRAFQGKMKEKGYLASVYGSGPVCKSLIAAGLAHSGWLSQSTGWAGYSEFVDKAVIVQGVETDMFGFNIDLDDVRDLGACW